MAKHTTNYPRLHVGPAAEEVPAATPVIGQSARLFAAFEEATGWAWNSAAASAPNGGESVRLGPRVSESSAGAVVEYDHAQDLAAAVSEVLAELQRTREELVRREADLAAGLPVSPRRREEEHLALRLKAILQGGAEAIGCQAAGLYMLDDATTELKLRSAWGLPDDRFLNPPRPLAAAFADLEAIVGHAVAVEDTSLLPQWRIPESFPAAVCVPVSSPTDPLGTVWFFAETTRDFTDEQTNLAEIVAGRIAAELQREVLLNECVAAKETDRRQLCATQWQRDHLPNVLPMLDAWQVAGWSADDDELAAGFYDWFVPADGSLAVALGIGEGTPVESALSAAALQAAVRSHANDGRAANELIDRVNETIWFGSAGGHFASLAYGTIRPDEDAIEIAAVGRVRGLMFRETQCEAVPVEPMQLGIEPEFILKPQRLGLSSGDLLVLLPADTELGELQAGLEKTLRDNRGASAEKLAVLIRREIPSLRLGLVVRHR